MSHTSSLGCRSLRMSVLPSRKTSIGWFGPVEYVETFHARSSGVLQKTHALMFEPQHHKHGLFPLTTKQN